MQLKRLNRRTNGLLFLWSVLLIATGSSDALDCGDSYITVNVESDCTNTTCTGECRNADTCCLEKCFEGNQPSAQEVAGCFKVSDAEEGCSSFVNQTECMAGNLNKTLGVCWNHVLYFIASHPFAQEISGFNPVNCPCDIGQTRKSGTCTFSQCFNGPVCEDRKDSIRNIDVCCLHDGIFPRDEDCDNTEKLDISVHRHLNVSTVVECQGLCQGGLCKMPNPTRLPACCKRIPKQVEGKDEDGLGGGVIAVIVIIIVVLVVVGTFSLIYLYRFKKVESQLKRARNSESVVKVTGVEEIMEEEHAHEEDGATYPNRCDYPTNGYSQSRDERKHVTVPDFSARVYSEDKLQNGNVHGFENRGFSGDNESFDEDHSYNSYRRRRTGSSVSEELGTDADNIQYVFDDGNGNFSDDYVQNEIDDGKFQSSEEDDHGV